MSRNNSFTWRLSLIIITIIDAIHRYIPSMSNPFISCTFCRKSRKSPSLRYVPPIADTRYEGYISFAQGLFVCFFGCQTTYSHCTNLSRLFCLKSWRYSVVGAILYTAKWKMGKDGLSAIFPSPTLRANSPGCLLCYHHNLGGYPPWFSLTLPRSPLFK